MRFLTAVFLLWVLASAAGQARVAMPDSICLAGADTVPIVHPDITVQVATAEKQCRSTEMSDSISQPRRRKGVIGLVKRIFDFLQDFDTTYVTPNYYNFAAMLQATSTIQGYRISAKTADGQTQAIKMNAPVSYKLGPYIGVGPIFLGYAFDVAKVGTSEKRTQMRFSFYTPIVGVDFMYFKNPGDFRIARVSGFDPVSSSELRHATFQGMDASTLGANAYYIFNYKHFSLPAAFSQSTVQRKSCGSWLLGFQYLHQNIKFDEQQLPPSLKNNLIDELKFRKMDYYDYSVSFGYAYNWVFAHNWLFSGVVAPAIGIKKTKGEKFWADEQPFRSYMRNFSIDAVTRFGIVWNNTRFFAGAGAVSHWYGFRKNSLNLTTSFHYVNLYFGINFARKKQYRKSF